MGDVHREIIASCKMPAIRDFVLQSESGRAATGEAGWVLIFQAALFSVAKCFVI